MACPTFQIHHRGPGSSPPGQDPPPRVGFSFPATLGFVAVLLPAADWYPPLFNTLNGV